jgi:hypothetical protein
MEPDQNFRLDWAEFQKNMKDTFTQLRSDDYFSDVTLACEDGQHIKAHKIILSSASPLLDSILKTIDHPKPLIYMRGMKSRHLTSLLDFIYNGEVQVTSNNFQDFLAVAAELKIKGLIGETSSTPDNECKVEDIDIDEQAQPVKESEILVEDSMHSCITCGKSSTSKAGLYKHMIRNHRDYYAKEPNSDSEIDTKENRYDHFLSENLTISKMDEPDVLGKDATKAYSCNICGKLSTSKNGLSNHKSRNHNGHAIDEFQAPPRQHEESPLIDNKICKVEATFTEATSPSLSCNICGKLSISKAGLNKHMIRNHKDES